MEICESWFLNCYGWQNKQGKHPETQNYAACVLTTLSYCKEDGQLVRLTQNQLVLLFNKPDTSSVQGLRNTSELQYVTEVRAATEIREI